MSKGGLGGLCRHTRVCPVLGSPPAPPAPPRGTPCLPRAGGQRCQQTPSLLLSPFQYIEAISNKQGELENYVSDGYKTALTEERRRFCFLVEKQCAVAKSAITYHAKVSETHLSWSWLPHRWVDAPSSSCIPQNSLISQKPQLVQPLQLGGPRG